MVFVVGTGVFGLSVAVRLLKDELGSGLSVISNPSPIAPSEDNSKIIRVDYADIDRMKEAIKAQPQWASKPVYHQIGRIVIYSTSDQETLERIRNNRHILGLPSRQDGVQTLEKWYGGTCDSHQVCVFNADDAIVDWKRFMSETRATIEAGCKLRGGHFQQAEVEKLVCCSQRVQEVQFASGGTIHVAETPVVLAVGPWCTQLLQKSDIELPPDGRIPTATGVFAYFLELSQDQIDSLKGAPIVSEIGRAEFLPPIGDNNIGKITWIMPFTNLKGNPLSSRVQDVSKSAFAISEQEKALAWLRARLPRLTGVSVVRTISYWDGVTTTQDPLISRHPSLENLIIVAGGSYTSAKDFPLIGNYVADLLGNISIPPRYSWKFTGSTHRHQPHLLAATDFSGEEQRASTRAI